MLKTLPIRLKLMLLAGVPVLGALILALSIANDARRQAASAAALGSIEDLARLAAHMSGLVHELQFERQELSLLAAEKNLLAPELKEHFARTDAARKQLEDFLAARQVSSFPPRLSRDLEQARERLRSLAAERESATTGNQPIGELWAAYKSATASLISATAALSQLADDGELIRAISALVTVLQIKERASQEHALLSHVFVLDEFPAGSFKDLVTLTTEEADYISVLEVNATDAVTQQFHDIQKGPEFARTADLRKLALDPMSEGFDVNPREWADVQGKKVNGYRQLEIELNDAVKVKALGKMAEARRSVVFAYSLGGGVIVISALLAGLIARGVSRSVASLSQAAEQVRRDKDFDVRATKTSEDELGALTDAFNDMLSGIQERDKELAHHRENLEHLVEQRTAALQRRNEAMRLVLDNVEQGLATIERDGTLSSERSRAFDTWFGKGTGEPNFAERLAHQNEKVRDALALAWEQVIEGFLPIETSIDQMPRHIQVDDRQYALSYKVILENDTLNGVLLVVSDVTEEMERMRRDAEQAEMLRVFERVMRDRVGFVEFFKECEALVGKVVGGEIRDVPLAMRIVHTIKGNCGMFGITSVAEVAHEIESFVIDNGSLPSRQQLDTLQRAWTMFAKRVLRLTGTEEEPVIEVIYEEFEELEQAMAARVPYGKLSELLGRLKFERGVARLRRVADQSKTLAHRLGKGNLEVVIEAGKEVRFQPERWSSFWSSFVHVIRNALDHGIESPAQRVAVGKRPEGVLHLRAQLDREYLTIELSDDGRGVAWSRVQAKAKERGLPHTTEQDLVNALFSDGLSTAESVSDISGRGVGMSAVRDATLALNGSVTVSSILGKGTTVRFRFPAAEVTKPNPFSRHPGARPSLVPPPPQGPASSRVSAA
jgi:two-component system chemotaxis sensor kinase CheA